MNIAYSAIYMPNLLINTLLSVSIFRQPTEITKKIPNTGPGQYSGLSEQRGLIAQLYEFT
jgi:hypothetical protein